MRLAPIAEYRGAALLEIPGAKRTVWNGTKYSTDGNIWLAKRERTPEGEVQLIGVGSEALAKRMLDDMTQDPAAVARYGLDFLSMAEVWELLGENRTVPKYEWDEQQGVFVLQA